MLKNLKENPFWIGAGLVVTGFISGFASYRVLIQINNQELVPKGGYVLIEDVRTKYVPKEECVVETPLSPTHKALVDRLFEYLKSTSEETLRAQLTARPVPCAPDNTEVFGVKAELLHYLYSKDDHFRWKAVAAYASCVMEVNEAFSLARTIRPNEPRETWDAYILSLHKIIKCNSLSETGRKEWIQKIKQFLSELNVPEGLVRSFDEASFY